jgi:predicted acetyltransferase
VLIEVSPTTLQQEPVLARLLELYAQDFREFYEVPLNADGRFVYEDLPLYWTETGRHPFLIRVDGELAGFVLVKRGSEVSGDPDVWDVAEFFVMREARRRGVGKKIAWEVWRRFPGRWEVRVREANRAAMAFWEKAIGEFAGDRVRVSSFEKDGAGWKLFSFESVPV